MRKTTIFVHTRVIVVTVGCCVHFVPESSAIFLYLHPTQLCRRHHLFAREWMISYSGSYYECVESGHEIVGSETKATFVKITIPSYFKVL